MTRIAQQAEYRTSGYAVAEIVVIGKVRFYSQEPRSPEHAERINEALKELEKIELVSK